MDRKMNNDWHSLSGYLSYKTGKGMPNIPGGPKKRPEHLRALCGRVVKKN